MGDTNQEGALWALQAQLDAVADVLGPERMRAADGYHATACRDLLERAQLLQRENAGLRARLAELGAEIFRLRRKHG